MKQLHAPHTQAVIERLHYKTAANPVRSSCFASNAPAFIACWGALQPVYPMHTIFGNAHASHGKAMNSSLGAIKGPKLLSQKNMLRIQDRFKMAFVSCGLSMRDGASPSHGISARVVAACHQHCLPSCQPALTWHQSLTRGPCGTSVAS
jgi:hypothetical protein